MALLGYSKLVIASYVLDIIILIAFGLISLGFSKITPHYHPFSVLDLSISYPYKKDTVSDTVLDVSAIAVPAIVIAIFSFVFVRVPGDNKLISWRTRLSLKGWEFASGWLGLALCHTTQIMIVTGLKNLIGKPRPDMLARCIPNVANLDQYIVGGYGNNVLRGLVLVNQGICTQTNLSTLNDGFRSFPSGHSSTSFAGLLYLSLWLCSKFSIWVPFFPRVNPPQSSSTNLSYTPRPQRSYTAGAAIVYRDEAAAPALWLVLIAYVPIAGAFYISASRYFDYHHHGFDILSGAFIGIVIAVLAFRFYHVPLGHSAGYAWGPRSRSRAFAVGVGRYGWVDVDEEEDDGGIDLGRRHVGSRSVGESDIRSTESRNRMLPPGHV